MSGRKDGLSLPEHVSNIAALTGMIRGLSEVLCALSRGYRNDSTVVAQTERAVKTIRALKHALAEKAAREHDVDLDVADRAEPCPVVQLVPRGRP